MPIKRSDIDRQSAIHILFILSFVFNVTITHSYKMIVASCMYIVFVFINFDRRKCFCVSVVVQEEGARKVFVYLNIPELKVKRSFPNVLKLIPSNGQEKTMDFQNQYEIDFDFLSIIE